MSMSINNLTFTGRVGAVFSIKKFSNGAMLEFTVAVRSNFKNKNGDYDVQSAYGKPYSASTSKMSWCSSRNLAAALPVQLRRELQKQTLPGKNNLKKSTMCPGSH